MTNDLNEQRCRCRHSARRHTVIVHAATDTVLAHGSCTQPDCPCYAFVARPTPWRVRRDPVDPYFIALLGPWYVESPRGVEVYRTHSQRTAHELARSFAAVDELLARVNRLEGTTYGDHPALRTSARKLVAVQGGAE